MIIPSRAHPPFLLVGVLSALAAWGSLMPCQESTRAEDHAGRTSAEEGIEGRKGRLATPVIIDEPHALTVTLSGDGRRMMTGNGRGILNVWDVVEGRQLLQLDWGRGPIQSVAFSPDGTRVAAGGAARITFVDRGNAKSKVHRGGAVGVWDTTGHEIVTFLGHTRAVNGVSFTAGGNRIVSLDRGFALKLWEATTGRGFSSIVPPGLSCGNGYEPQALAVFSASGHQAASLMAEVRERGCQAGPRLKIWDFAMGRFRTVGVLDHPEDTPRSVAISPDGKLLAIGGHNKLQAWDPVSGMMIRNFDGLLAGWPAHLAFAPDGKRLIAIGYPGSGSGVNEWEVETGRRTPSFPDQAIEELVRAIAFIPNGLRVVTGGWEGPIRIRDVRLVSPRTNP